MSIISLSSCSKSDQPSAESNVIGNWSGIIIQSDFGELWVDFSINTTTLNGQAGTGTFKSGDISVCDPSQFNCTPLACSFSLSVFSMLDNFDEIDQVHNETASTCGDGTFEVCPIDDNNFKLVWYEEAFPDNRASGTLTRQLLNVFLLPKIENVVRYTF